MSKTAYLRVLDADNVTHAVVLGLGENRESVTLAGPVPSRSMAACGGRGSLCRTTRAR